MASSSRTSGASGRLAVIPANSVCWRSGWLAIVRGCCCTLLLYGTCLIGSCAGRGADSATVRFSGRTYPKLLRIVRALSVVRCRWSLPLAVGRCCCCCCHRCCQLGAGHPVASRPRTLQGMARVRSGQAPAWPLSSDRSVRRGSRIKRDFACTFTRRFPAVLVALRSQSCLRLEGRARTLSGPSPALSPARTHAPSAWREDLLIRNGSKSCRLGGKPLRRGSC